MLKLTSARKRSTKLPSGEIMQYIPLPELPYDKLKVDFAKATHLATIDKLDLKGAGGVMIRCHYLEDGLLAASYIFKKLVIECEPNVQVDFDDDDYNYDDDSEAEENGVESVLYTDNKFVHLPVISVSEFANSFQKQPQFSAGQGYLNTRIEGEVKAKEPYWMKGEYPLIVEDKEGYHLHSKEPFEYFEQTNRFLIYIRAVREERELSFASHLNIGYFEKSILFETNMEYCAVEKPSVLYYENVISDIIKAKGYKIAKTTNKTKLVKDLIDYRGSSFRSSVDMDAFVNKAINKKRDDSKIISQSDFDQLFVANEIRRASTNLVKGAAAELDELIGLAEAKNQLKRMVKRMVFDKKRRSSGYKTSDTHAAAVFMGSPGTAKTTVARIFGRMLCEENVLSCDIFKEVARKDLVGKYVGWTAPTIAKVFEEAEGGTIFIDEAYSLMNENNSDGFSDEALSEIIRQMENNPNTLVIFAGYTDKMRQFIQNANPGLRSRLTNVIEFKDYELTEMCGMFTYFVDKEQYILDNPTAAEHSIKHFVSEIKTMQSENMGNGRLIRKLFKSAIGYMAEREDNDLKTLMSSDIDKAAAEIVYAEKTVTNKSDSNKTIGFHQRVI